MAAPSGTVWGSVVGSYGKLGLYVSRSSTDTQTTVTVEIWFASKYSVSDSANTLYYDIGYAKDGGATTSKGSVSVSTSVASGSGWSTSNQVKLKTYTTTYTRANSTATKYVYAKLADIDRVGGTMSVSTTVQVPGLASYAVKYNANGGSGAPSAQTKYYGKNLTLSSSKPTRTGYTFQKWNTNSSGTGTSYNPGAVYSGNAALTLYAIWKANTYTVTFNANGGSLGSVSSTQTKTYGVAMTLPTAKPTRTNYTFVGWSTSNTATSATYSAGGSFTTNANTTLYAVWSLAYTPPRVKITSIYRGTWLSTENAFIASDDGKHCQFIVSVSTDKTIIGMTTTVYDSSGTVFGNIITWSDFTDFTKTIDGREFDPEKTYRIEFTVTDEGGSSTAIAYLPSTKYIIDIRKGGTGLALNKTAELEDVFDIGFQTKFTGGIYNEPLLKATDLNDLKTPNTYVGINDVDYTNQPSDLVGTFTLEVMSAGAEGQVLQRITQTTKDPLMIYIRHYYQSTWGEWCLLQESQDTGWLDITLSSGITVGDTAWFKARVKNGVLYIDGSIKGVSANWKNVGALPTTIKNLITTKETRFPVLYDLSKSFGALLNASGAIYTTISPTGTWDSSLSIHFNHAFAVDYK